MPVNSNTTTTLACYRCGKEIKGKYVFTSPSVLARSLGDFPKAFHPACYDKAEAEAAKELRIGQPV